MHDISRIRRPAAALLMVLLGTAGALSPLAYAADGAEADAATALIASAALTPTALADEAVAANPSLVSQQAMADQLHEQATVAGAWPDPVAAIEYSNVPLDTWSISDHPMAGIQLRVQQTLHPPAWSRQQRDVGELRARVAEAMVDESAVALRAAVEQTWWGLVQTRLLRQVTVDHIARTDELLDAVRSRYQVGQAAQSAVLRLTVLRDRLTDDLGDYTRRDAELVAALDDALARDRANAATPSVYDTPSVLAPLPPPADADWVALAGEHRPELARLAAQRDTAKAAQSLARTQGLPDPAVWAGYRLRTAQTATDPGTDLVSVGISVPIPTGSGRRARGEIAGWVDAARAADQATESLLDRIAGDMRALLARWVRAAEKTQTYDQSLVPSAQNTLDATLNDFTVGRTDFASLFDAEVTLLNLDRARIMAATETWQLRARAFSVLGIHPEASSR